MYSEQDSRFEEVTCISESNYAHVLTYGQTYRVLDRDPNKQHIKLQGDNGRIRWFPEGCFAPGQRELPKLTRILEMDPLVDPQTTAVEVTIELSTGQRRWCWFNTPETLARSDGVQMFSSALLIRYNAPHMIVVSTLSKQVIEQTLKYIERQGELLDCTKLIEEDPISDSM